jgi:hypothetical protein
MPSHVQRLASTVSPRLCGASAQVPGGHIRVAGHRTVETTAAECLNDDLLEWGCSFSAGASAWRGLNSLDFHGTVCQDEKQLGISVPKPLAKQTITRHLPRLPPKHCCYDSQACRNMVARGELTGVAVLVLIGAVLIALAPSKQLLGSA